MQLEADAVLDVVIVDAACQESGHFGNLPPIHRLALSVVGPWVGGASLPLLIETGTRDAHTDTEQSVQTNEYPTRGAPTVQRGKHQVGRGNFMDLT